MHTVSIACYCSKSIIFPVLTLIYLMGSFQLLELFGAGTAAVVCPVGSILYKDELLKIPTMEVSNQLFRRALETLTDIQYGRVKHKWAIEID